MPWVAITLPQKSSPGPVKWPSSLASPCCWSAGRGRWATPAAFPSCLPARSSAWTMIPVSVADYAASLRAELRRHGAVEVSPATCDVALYHLANNPLHAAIYARSLETPGVVVLHDAVLNHFFLGTLDQPAYIEEFVYNYGEWSRSLAASLWRERASSSTDRRYFDYPMLKRIAERSRAVVVHNPAAAAMVREHTARARIVEIPHLFATPGLPGPAQAIRYRQTLGIEPGAFLFGLFGYLRESKRLRTVLDAF